MINMWNEIHQQPEVLEKCSASNANVIRELVGELKRRDIRSVSIAARGTSDHAAVYGKYMIELNTALPVALSASSVFTVYKKSLQFANSLVIGISQSGRAEDVLEVVRCANRHGAVTVAITNFPDSELAREAKYHLYCDAGLETSVAATKTFTAQLYLLGLFTAEWSGEAELKKALEKVPDLIRETFQKTEPALDARVARYRFMDECFVLARGINYSVSLEAALKIQETTYVRAKAFATSDFQHGPIAMVERDIPVIIFAPQGPSYADVSGMAARLKAENVELIVISNVKDILALAESPLEIPYTENDAVSPFLNAVTAQMFACRLAGVKGLNPDSPRGLKKVTITR